LPGTGYDYKPRDATERKLVAGAVHERLNIQPTFIDIPGQPLRVVVHKDIVLAP